MYLYLHIYVYNPTYITPLRDIPPAHVAREAPYAAVSFCCLGLGWEGGHREEWVRE